MTNILRDKQSKFVMMWLVCMISLALCLHFNEHVTENEFQRHVSIDAIHSHHHEVNYYEHFVGYDVLKSIALAHLLKGISILDWCKEYVFLMISRIFKPPKK
jgi:hypothetical protein